MTAPVEVSASRTFPAAVEHAFDVVMPAPLEKVFARRFLALPAVRAVRDQRGSWSTVGQTRTIVLADGGTMREELTAVERPAGFGYALSDITGVMKLLVASATGRWSFEPAGTGVRVTWTWTLQPASQVGALAMPAFARMWRGYARQALEELEPMLLGTETSAGF
jgi:hypothetical protein